MGNRTASHQGSSYSYQPFNRLVTVNSNGYSYDLNGNLTSRTEASGTWTYTWDYENRLTQASLSGGLSVNYSYDALGRRVQRITSSGANERYVYDGHDVLLDLNADSSVATTYLNDLGIDYHLRQTSSVSGTSYFLTNHLGSTAALADANGDLIEEVSYDSFGNHTASSGTRYTYTGREHDPDTELLYYRARWHDPTLGRFLSQDPIGFEGNDINLYVYVHNQPITLIDPFGKQVRADARWRPGEIEAMRRLGDRVRSMGSCSGGAAIYICCRNINLNPFTEFLSQVTGVRHCFIKTPNIEAGMNPPANEPQPFWPFGTPTEITSHTGQSKGAFSCVPVCNVDQKCVENELAIGKPTGKWSLSNNCNTFANEIVRKCQKTCCGR